MTDVPNEVFNVFVESGNLTLLVKSLSGMADFDDDESVDDCEDEVGVEIISVDIVDGDNDVDAVIDAVTDAVTTSGSVRVLKSGSV